MHSTDSALDTGVLWIPSYKKECGRRKERDGVRVQSNRLTIS